MFWVYIFRVCSRWLCLRCIFGLVHRWCGFFFWCFFRLGLGILGSGFISSWFRSCLLKCFRGLFWGFNECKGCRGWWITPELECVTLGVCVVTEGWQNVGWSFQGGMVIWQAREECTPLVVGAGGGRGCTPPTHWHIAPVSISQLATADFTQTVAGWVLRHQRWQGPSGRDWSGVALVNVLGIWRCGHARILWRHDPGEGGGGFWL